VLKDAITNSHNLRLPVPIQKKSELHHHTSLATVNLNVPWQAMAYEICTMKFSLGGFLVHTNLKCPQIDEQIHGEQNKLVSTLYTIAKVSYDCLFSIYRIFSQ